MKQRITIEQLKELNVKQIENLNNLWEPDLGDWFYDLKNEEIGIVCGTSNCNEILSVTWFFGGDTELERTNLQIPLLSIGQMIDIIREKNGFKPSMACMESSERLGNELCDSLWNVISEALS